MNRMHRHPRRGIDRFTCPLFLILPTVLLHLSSVSPLHPHNLNPQTTVYTKQDGLSNPWVNCLYQDRQGFLWIGTQDGLNRYDGYSFKQYIIPSASDPKDLRNCVWAIVEDEADNLWIGTADGLDRRDRKRGTITHFRHDPGKPNGLSSDGISALYLDSDGKLWVGTGGRGLTIIDTRIVNRRVAEGKPPGNDFTVLRSTPGNTRGLSSNIIFRVFQDRDGMMWICTNLGVDLFDPRKNTWRHYPAASALRAGTVYQDGIGNVWIAKEKLLRFDKSTRQMRTILPTHISRIVPGSGNRVILAGKDILYSYSLDEVAKIPAEFDRSAQAGQTYITDCIKDRAGSIWIGTRTGLHKREDEPQFFTALKAVPAVMHKELTVTSLLENDDSSLTIGTLSTGLCKLRRGDTAILLSRPAGLSSRIARAENVIFSIRKFSEKFYAIGSAAGMYLLSMDLRHRQRIGYGERDVAPKLGIVFTLLEDSRGNIWFGGRRSGQARLYRFEKRTGAVDSTGILQQKFKAQCGGSTYVWTMLEDNRRRIWIGTDKGLGCFNYSDSSLHYYRHTPNDRGSLSNDQIRSMLQDRRGDIYIGTWGGGLNVFDEHARNFVRYTEKNGLSNNTISGMLEDGRGNIWIATNYGLSRFNPTTRMFTQYYDEVIQSIGIYHSHAFLKTRDGQFHFGGNGLLSFHPDRIRDDTTFPPVVITSFAVLGEEIRDDIGNGETVAIPWQQNYFSFDFAALEYREPRKIQYAYMLEGVNTDWVYVTQRTCSFTNLSPGEYQLRIKSTNSRAIWNPQQFVISLRIIPPIYMTSWFRWAAGILAALCLAFLWDRRVRHIRKKETAKRYLIEAELQALRLQMNPHFLFNSLNAIQNFLFDQNEIEANKYLTKFARLMRMILENSRRKTIPVSEELEALNLYLELEALRFEFRFSYEFVIDPSVDTTRHMPSMLIQPYIENAIRHGLMHREEKGHLRVELTQDDDALLCSIVDNGIGREKARAISDRSRNKESIGMSVTEKRLVILNQLRKRPLSVKVTDLKDAAGEAAGTRIDISIPVE